MEYFENLWQSVKWVVLGLLGAWFLWEYRKYKQVQRENLRLREDAIELEVHSADLGDLVKRNNERDGSDSKYR